MSELPSVKNLWNQSAVPHKGWVCVDVIDNETADATCKMCGNERIRYVHVMAHPQNNTQLDVGCVCAEKMTNDYVNPKRRERALRNKAARTLRRKKRLAQIKQEQTEALQRATWSMSQNGNVYLSVLSHGYACHLVVVKSKFGDYWAFGLNGNFSPYKYTSVGEAKQAARAAALREKEQHYA